jgi:hypothetical protein
MNIGSIVWPADAKAACNHYLEFLIKSVSQLKIVFPTTQPDPCVVARRYIDGVISDEEYAAEARQWWLLVDSVDGSRITRERTALIGRLALCLLSATRDQAPLLGDHLSWFLEVLGFIGMDLHEPLDMMTKHFKSI